MARPSSAPSGRRASAPAAGVSPGASSGPSPAAASAASGPGILAGIGLGGFVDGWALHQIAQWHNMGSAVLPPVTMMAMKQNMVWDGWFHAAVWACTLAGVYWLVAAARAGRAMPDARQLTGQLLLGWGLFNLVEGVVDHHLLELHHVRDVPVHVPLYDWLFLAVGGVGLIVLGWLLARPAVPGAARRV